MTHSHSETFHTIALAIALNIALGLSGVSFMDKVSPNDITDFSTKVIANFGITQEVNSNTRVKPLNGIYRAEATPNKRVETEHNTSPSQKRNKEIANVFSNYSQTFQIFSEGL